MSATARLQRELVAMAKSAPSYIRARPLEDDILTFHYVVDGPPDSPFEGGCYHGLLRFPPEYPMRPPAVLMLTPNGRFAVNTRLCLSMSDFHPETWNPVWSCDKILLGLLSFMVESGATAGSIVTSDDAKRAYARESLAHNCKNKDFARLFPELVEKHAAARAAADAAAAAAGGGAAGGADAAGARADAGAGARGGARAAAASVLPTLFFVTALVALLVAASFFVEGGGPDF
jgi:ubiquitin-conjugating enzyme E2 J2